MTKAERRKALNRELRDEKSRQRTAYQRRNIQTDGFKARSRKTARVAL